MEWYTYTTIAMMNAAILIWTVQRSAPINSPKIKESLSVLNLAGILIVSAWCLVYGIITESLIVKEVSTALFACTLISLAVHLYRAYENSGRHAKNTPAPSRRPTRARET